MLLQPPWLIFQTNACSNCSSLLDVHVQTLLYRIYVFLGLYFVYTIAFLSTVKLKAVVVVD